MSNASTDTRIRIGGLAVQIHRKAIKNLHLAVLPPDGKVRVSVPAHITTEAVRLAVIDKLGWIKRQQKAFQEQARQAERRYVSGETHYFFGRAYRLKVQDSGKTHISIGAGNRLVLSIRSNADAPARERAMERWYREQLKARVPALLEKWQPKVGKQATCCGIKKMKTKWGSCNTDTGSIWLNLELAKKPVPCLDYILVHELVHLHERTHNEQFRGWMDRLMPDWSERRRLLNQSPLSHEYWQY
ncbi:metal-dependent hydrolase [Chromatiales bacterium (ex Bugula neritina AB1)]|nr:metal-dependent hydrolase [Chromatiales bacterium (ex Bugula neritina AB1)]